MSEELKTYLPMKGIATIIHTAMEKQKDIMVLL